jgi:hypothetical protein
MYQCLVPTRSPRERTLGLDALEHEPLRDQASEERKPPGGVSDR